MKVHHTTLIGCGGIGSQLIEPLTRMLHHHNNSFARILLVDGDTFEARNAERQHFDPEKHVGLNKANVALGRAASALPAQEIDQLDTYEKYLNGPLAFAGLLTKHASIKKCEADKDSFALVVIAVDNDMTRRMVYDGLPMVATDAVPRVFVLDAANEYDTASVAAFARVDGQDALLSPVTRYANLRTPKDRAPGGGCLAEAPTTPQLLVANAAAAFGVLVQVQALLDGKRFTDDLKVNIRTMEMASQGGWFDAP